MVHGTEQGMVQSSLRTRSWMAAGIVGLMLLVAMIFVLPVNVSADDSVDIGTNDENEFATFDEAKSRLQDELKVAEVSQSGNIITVKMTQNVTGRISFNIPKVEIRFDANGKILTGGGTAEPLCFDHVYNGDSTATIFGNGTFYGSKNYALYIGLGQTVTIESGTFTTGGLDVFGGQTKHLIDKRTTCKHSYNKEPAIPILRTVGANCQDKNTYWYVCETCGASAKDDETATDKYYKGTEAGPHNMSSDWQHGTKDEQQTHYKACTVKGCNYIEDEGICSGGTATCKQKAVCEECGAAYGTKADHNYVWIITDEMHWMQCQTEGCDSIAERGGHFDMDKDGKCDACTYEMKLTPDPVSPADPKNPDTVKTAEASQQTTDKTPKTGDDNFAAPLLAALFLSGSLGALCITNRKRENM